MKFRFSLIPRMTVALLLGLAAAAAAQTTVTVSESDEHGLHVVTSEGMSLYLYLPDNKERASCEAGCAVGWPPLLADGGVVAGEGVDESLLGTIERADGTQQVTYGGWPLYSFRRDRNAGDTAGQGVGDEWYLVSPVGEALGHSEAAGESAAAATLSPEVQALMDEGAPVYAKNCAVCHGAQGDEARATHVEILAGNGRAVGDAGRTIRQVLNGGTYMPGFGQMLSDREVAAVVTFIRNSWGNDFGPVTEEEVVEQR